MRNYNTRKERFSILFVTDDNGGAKMEKKTMNVQELAQQLGISKPTAYELCKREDFPHINIGKRVVIPVAAFEQWLIDTASNKTAINAGR